MTTRPHPLAFVLGFAGLVPFVACGLAALALPDERAERMMVALIGYGAVILSFLGGVHWGFALADPEARLVRARLALGVLPSLVGWLAVLLPMLLPSDLGLLTLVLGFVATVAAEAQAHRRGLTPGGYMGLRWLLSGLVILVLGVVLILRLVGAHVTL